jgi:GAF domain-containing protein
LKLAWRRHCWTLSPAATAVRYWTAPQKPCVAYPSSSEWRAVTHELALDHQLPQLIELIVAGLDAERATLFLYDPETGELFSRVAQGEGVTEIRIRANSGIAGAAYASGETEIVSDAYQDPRFNQASIGGPGFARATFCACRCATVTIRRSA